MNVPVVESSCCSLLQQHDHKSIIIFSQNSSSQDLDVCQSDFKVSSKAVPASKAHEKVEVTVDDPLRDKNDDAAAVVDNQAINAEKSKETKLCRDTLAESAESCCNSKEKFDKAFKGTDILVLQNKAESDLRNHGDHYVYPDIDHSNVKKHTQLYMDICADSANMAEHIIVDVGPSNIEPLVEESYVYHESAEAQMSLSANPGTKSNAGVTDYDSAMDCSEVTEPKSMEEKNSADFTDLSGAANCHVGIPNNKQHMDEDTNGYHKVAETRISLYAFPGTKSNDCDTLNSEIRVDHGGTNETISVVFNFDIDSTEVAICHAGPTKTEQKTGKEDTDRFSEIVRAHRTSSDSPGEQNNTEDFACSVIGIDCNSATSLNASSSFDTSDSGRSPEVTDAHVMQSAGLGTKNSAGEYDFSPIYHSLVDKSTPAGKSSGEVADCLVGHSGCEQQMDKERTNGATEDVQANMSSSASPRNDINAVEGVEQSCVNEPKPVDDDSCADSTDKTGIASYLLRSTGEQQEEEKKVASCFLGSIEKEQNSETEGTDSGFEAADEHPSLSANPGKESNADDLYSAQGVDISCVKALTLDMGRGADSNDTSDVSYCHFSCTEKEQHAEGKHPDRGQKSLTSPEKRKKLAIPSIFENKAQLFSSPTCTSPTKSMEAICTRLSFQSPQRKLAIPSVFATHGSQPVTPLSLTKSPVKKWTPAIANIGAGPVVPEPDSKKDDIKNKDLFTAGLLPKKEISDRTMPLPLCVSRDGHVKATPNAQGLCRVSTSKKSMLDPIMLEMQIERTKQRVAKLTLASQIALLDEQIEVAKKKRITGAEADSIEDSAPSPNFESTFQILHDQGAARDVDDNLLNSRAIFEPLNPYKDTKDSQKHFEIVGIIPTLSISAQAVPTNPSHKPPKNEAIANPTILEKDYEQVNLKKPITSEIRFPSAGCGAIIIVAPTSEEMTELANTEADTEQAVREENTRCVDVAEILTTDETTTIGSGCSLPSAGEISMNKQTMTVEETEGDLKPKAGKKEKVQNSASPVVDSEEGSTKEAAINEVCGRKVPSSEIDSLDDVTPTAEEMDEGSKVHVDAYEGLESTASPVVNSAEDPTMRVIATDGYKYACASPSFEEISRDDISIHEPAQISKQNAYGKHDDDKESSNLVDDKKPKKKLRKLRSFFKKVQQKSRRRIET